MRGRGGVKRAGGTRGRGGEDARARREGREGGEARARGETTHDALVEASEASERVIAPVTDGHGGADRDGQDDEADAEERDDLHESRRVGERSEASFDAE